MLNKCWFLLVLGVIAISLLLRVYHLDRYPLDTNNDSQAYAWAGSSLLSDPTQPQSMSLFVLNNPNLFWFSHHNYFDTVRRYDFRLVDPFFDQPPFMLPLFGILPKLFGYTDYEPIPEVLLRIPAIIASFFTLILTYLLAKNLWNKNIAILSLLILGFTPYYVFAHREAFLENFITPIYLAGLLAVFHYLKTKRKIFFYGIILCAIIAPLFKIIGITLAIISVLFLYKNNAYKEAVIIGVAGALSLMAYFVYGYTVNSEAFSWILDMQSSRGVYAGSFLDFILRPEFYQPFRDGWYVFNFITFLWLSFSKRKQLGTSYITLTTFFIIASIVATAGVNNNFPWYRYPLFPFLSISSAVFIYELVTEKRNILAISFFSLFALSNAYLVTPMFTVFSNSLLIRSIIVFLCAFVALDYIQPHLVRENIKKWFIIILMMTTLVINAIVVVTYPKIFCLQTECKLPTKIVVPNN